MLSKRCVADQALFETFHHEYTTCHQVSAYEAIDGIYSRLDDETIGQSRETPEKDGKVAGYNPMQGAGSVIHYVHSKTQPIQVLNGWPQSAILAGACFFLELRDRK